MTDQQKGVLTLIKSALEGKSYTLPEGFDMAEAVKTALRHKIIALVYYGAIYCGVDKRSEPMQKLFPYLIATMNVVQKQCYEQERLCAAFEEAGIDFMPMKGMVIRDLYPKPEMRTMGDADILIREEQYPKIRSVMQSLAYSFERENSYELAWRKGKIEIELHKKVVPAVNEDLYAYLGDGWERACPIQDGACRFVMTREDFYIYLFVHLTKHYRSAGVGIKHVLDLWVYRQAERNLDDTYIRQELQKARLWDFHECVMQTIQVWFYDAQADSRTDCVTEVVFSSGEFGHADNREMGRILKEAKKVGSVKKVRQHEFWRAAFLPFGEMKKKYRILKYLPFLLPIMWIVRCFEVMLFQRKKLKTYVGKSGEHSIERIEERKLALNLVGLDFYTQEQIEE